MASSVEAPPPSSSVVNGSLSAVHSDILETHILTRLDGPTLASAACVSSQLSSLTSKQSLWTNICHSTWPSTDTPRIQQLISTFAPHGPRSFFSNSFTNPDPDITTTTNHDHCRSSELISAVDIYHRNEFVFSKVVETETESGWFMCSPFRVDILDPKDMVPTRIPYPDTDNTCQELEEDFMLSWVLIDPIGLRAMNLSTYKAVSVQRHWLSGEIQIRFGSILSGGQKGSGWELSHCEIMVTCGGTKGGEMHVSEVCLQVEDMDGMHLNGKDILVILDRGFEGKRGNIRGREVKGKKRYEEYMERRRERKEKKLKREGRLDMLCVVCGVIIFSCLGSFIFWR
ncbi:probable F-box protein At2g36090 [Pistacia vera]|uniref:probable F-box protein At2g36090 n=1 Tax=Pistacia vera TaxID=55513 RepID=UPI001263199D|nr:probable F-box protein At2g36090 [Pistacia vera]